MYGNQWWSCPRFQEWHPRFQLVAIAVPCGRTCLTSYIIDLIKENRQHMQGKASQLFVLMIASSLWASYVVVIHRLTRDTVHILMHVPAVTLELLVTVNVSYETRKTFIKDNICNMHASSNFAIHIYCMLNAEK